MLAWTASSVVFDVAVPITAPSKNSPLGCRRRLRRATDHLAIAR
jgi:hypothetical protein